MKNIIYSTIELSITTFKTTKTSIRHVIRQSKPRFNINIKFHHVYVIISIANWKKNCITTIMGRLHHHHQRRHRLHFWLDPVPASPLPPYYQQQHEATQCRHINKMCFKKYSNEYMYTTGVLSVEVLPHGIIKI